MLLECCNSSDLLDDSAVISTKDSYYCGMTLISSAKVDSSVLVVDGNGKVLAFVIAIGHPSPVGYKQDCPSEPIPALKGIETLIVGQVEYVVRYAETISGIRRR